jgi:hypothetical protein
MKERDHLEDPSADGRMALNRIFKKWNGRHGMDCCGSEYGQVGALVNAVMNLRAP